MKYILLFILTVTLSGSAYAQSYKFNGDFISSTALAEAVDPVDSAVVSKIITDGNTKIVAAIKGQAKEISDSLKAIIKPATTEVLNLKQSDSWSHLLCFLPILFFLLLLIGIAVKLKRDNISLADFLIDKEQQVAIKKEETKSQVANAEAKEALVKAAGANPEAIRAAIANLNQTNQADPSTPDPTQSTSRLIVFITGIISLLIAVCMTSFFFYRWSLGDRDIDFSSLSTVLYGLGLGILPYGFTKIAGILK